MVGAIDAGYQSGREDDGEVLANCLFFPPPEQPLSATVSAQTFARASLAAYAATPHLRLPAEHRLAFREGDPTPDRNPLFRITIDNATGRAMG